MPELVSTQPAAEADVQALFPHMDFVVPHRLKQLLERLPAQLATPIAIVQHLPPPPSRLAEVLGFSSRLPVRFASHGEVLRASTVFIVPPCHHLIISADRRFALEGSPRR